MTAFARSVWEFVVGDDWRVAAAMVAAFGVSAAVAAGHVGAWWVLPVSVAVVLTMSLMRAARSTR